MIKRFIWGLIPLIALLALPFALRPAPEARMVSADGETDKLVIYTPHTESVKREFEQAFRRYYRQKHGRDIQLDFRSPGGTSDIVRYIEDRYTAAFRQEWERTGREWTSEIAGAFNNARLKAPVGSEALLAREMFLASNVSMGADLFWGGGTFDHARNAQKGYAVDGKIQEDYPAFFVPEAMDAEVSGDRVYDAQGRFYGVCLASFGLCYNRDRIAAMRNPAPPAKWEDLTEWRFFRQLAVADPTKSGSIAKCFELIVQQAITEELERGNTVSSGWDAGINRIRMLVANAGVVTESASQVANLVARGEFAAGMAIDFYALTTAEWLEKQTDAPSPLVYAVPYKGSSASADPIQLLRGAPNREAAREWIAFLLSLEGQKLLNFKVGVPGGPERSALRRAPVRKELYQPEYREFRSDPDYNPYRDAGEVIYHPEWTGAYFNLLRVMIRCTMLDVQEELAAAWSAIHTAGGPAQVPEAWAEFRRLPFAYGEALEMSNKLWMSKDWTPADIAAMRRNWTIEARDQYVRAAELARLAR